MLATQRSNRTHMHRMHASREDVRLSRWALSFSVPLVLLPSSTSGQAEILHSASGSLIDTGKKLLLLTCEHVWGKFADYCADNPEAAIAVGRGKTSVGSIITNIPVIERSELLDLAILDFTEHNVFEETQQDFAQISTWPPARPAVGDRVVLTGFPGTAKRPIDEGANLQFNAATIITPVSAVNDRHFVLADEKQVRRMWVRSDLVPNYRVFFGGMSGGPAFVLRDGRYEFAGVLRAGPETDPREFFFVSHADFVTTDGKIDWPTIPFI